MSRGSGPQDRWGRAAARTLPTRVGTGCRPSVTSLHVVGKEPYESTRPFFGGVEAVGERLRGGTTQTVRLAAPVFALRARAKVITAGA